MDDSHKLILRVSAAVIATSLVVNAIALAMLHAKLDSADVCRIEENGDG